MLEHEMEQYLEDVGPRLPVWTFSYNRAGKAPFLETTRTWKDQSINVVVRESQVDAYAAAYPWATLHPVPDAGDCVGASRQAALDYALLEGHELICLVDDDLTNVGWLFQGYFKTGKNVGAPCSRRTSRLLPDLQERVLAGISGIARTVAEQHPDAVLGGGLKQHGAIGDNLHRTMYMVNKGVTPKQLMTVNTLRLAQAGVRLNTDLFGRHGDDIGLVAEILKAGLQCYAMPSFVFDVWPEEINIGKSVVRNADTARDLHAEEWEALQQYPIRDYLRTKNSIVDGSFEWADVNWQKYAKVTGVQPETVLWPLDAARDIL